MEIKDEAKLLRIFIPLIFLLQCIFNPANAQGPKIVNLQEAIRMALDSNLSVKSAAYTAAAHQTMTGASWDIPKTVIGAQYGQINSYQKDNSFGISQDIAFPGVYINQHKLAKANAVSSEWQLKGTRLELATQVRQVYWHLVYIKAKHSLLLYQDSLYAGILRAADLRARTGETTRLEMITAHTQRLEVKNQAQMVETDLGIYNRKLQTLLNSAIMVTPADTVLRVISFSFSDDSLALAENPSLAIVRQQEEMARITSHLEHSRMMPDMNIGYVNQTMIGTQEVDGTLRSFDAGYRFSGFQAGIAIPLWFGPGVTKIKAAKLQEEASKAYSEYYILSLQGSFRSLLDEYKKYSTSVDYYEQQAVPEANLIIEQATQSYKSGALDYIEYVITLNRALNIRQNYLDAMNNCNQAIINIEFITGKVN